MDGPAPKACVIDRVARFVLGWNAQECCGEPLRDWLWRKGLAERSGFDHGLLGCRHLKVQLPEALRRLPGGRSAWTGSLRVRVGEIIKWLEPSWPERARALPGVPLSSIERKTWAGLAQAHRTGVNEPARCVKTLGDWSE